MIMKLSNFAWCTVALMTLAACGGGGSGGSSASTPVVTNDAAESVDTDGDGIGNNADTDDDGDGLLDVFEGQSFGQSTFGNAEFE